MAEKLKIEKFCDNDDYYDKTPVMYKTVRKLRNDTAKELEKYIIKLYELETRIEELEKQLKKSN